MSLIDTKFTTTERTALLSEVKHYLPAFLSSASTEQEDPVGDASELLNLSKSDLDRVIAVHIALSEPVQLFLGELQRGLRNPATSSIRTQEVSQLVRGAVDWGATIRHRARTGVGGCQYVVRPAERIFDVPENRALIWAIDRLRSLLQQALPSPEETHGSSGWAEKITSGQESLWLARRHQWTRAVPPQRPDATAWNRLMATRRKLYAVDLVAVLNLFRQYIDEPTANDVVELIESRYFEPSRDWQLFEVVVALRLEAAFRKVLGRRRKTRLLVGGARAPFARFELDNGCELRLWYQSWPRGDWPSAHRNVRSRFEIQGGDPRPDLVIEYLDRKLGATDFVLIELKASRDPTYLSQGIFQILGYLKDRSTMFFKKPYGWLVAPTSGAFLRLDQSDDEVWVVSADDVAAAAVERLHAWMA